MPRGAAHRSCGCFSREGLRGIGTTSDGRIQVTCGYRFAEGISILPGGTAILSPAVGKVLGFKSATSDKIGCNRLIGIGISCPKNISMIRRQTADGSKIKRKGLCRGVINTAAGLGIGILYLKVAYVNLRVE